MAGSFESRISSISFLTKIKIVEKQTEICDLILELKTFKKTW